MRRSSGCPSPCTGQRPVLGVHHFVPFGSCSVVRVCLSCNIPWACVPSQLAFAVLYYLSFRERSVRFLIGTQKTRLLRGRSRWLGSSSPFSWSPCGVNLRTPLRRTISCSDASHAGAGASGASVFVRTIDQQVQSSAETAAAETNEELVQQAVVDSAQCSCVSWFSTCSPTCSLGCPARFCSASCFATHQASCPLVMITFHESLKGDSMACPSALQPLLGYVSEVVFRDRVLYSRVSAPAGPQSHRGIFGPPCVRGLSISNTFN